MPLRKKNTSLQSAPIASQSEGHGDSESSSSEDTPPQSEEGGSRSGGSEESGSKFVAGSGSQSATGSKGSIKSESRSQEDTTTSPPAIVPETSIGGQTETAAAEGDDEVTPDDTLSHVEGDQVGRLLRTWNCEQVRGIHQFEWMTNAPGDYTCHLPQEFYAIYTATLMNIVVETETTKRAHKTLATTLAPLYTINIQGKTVSIYEEIINRMLHGPEYTTPASVGLFEGKHHTVTSESEIKDPTSRKRIMDWIVSYIATKGEAVTWVSDPHVQITKESLTFPANVWWSIVRAQL
ncbi:hypothetical protein KY284_007888 [Solanum tuberosum]|nr:hypothetical protein KY284_007888 [Solanum tuberosum]